MSRRVCFGLTLCTLVCASAGAGEAPYPSRPIRVIVPFAPGGSTDVIARLVGQKLTEAWGQQVIVDNRAGAGGDLGMGMAAKANPDGHTILSVSSSYMVNPTLYSKAPYDPFKTFVLITNAAAAPNIFTAHASAPVKSLAELIALAKKDPKKFNIGTPGVGTTPDLSAELFRMTAQPDIRERISGLGFDVIASTPAEFAAQIRVEVEKWGKVIRSAGMKAD